MRHLCLMLAGGWLAIGAAVALADPPAADEADDTLTSPPPATQPAPRDTDRRPPRDAGRSGRERTSPDGQPRRGWRERGDDDEARPPRPGPPDGEAPDGPGFAPRLERLEETLRFLKENYPDQYARLAALRKDSPREFYQQMRHILPRIRFLMDTMQRNPALGEVMVREHRLEMDIRDAVETYHKTTDEQKAADLRARVRELVGQQFDARQRRLQLMIEELEKELARKKDMLADQARRRDTCIDEDLERRLRGEHPPGPPDRPHDEMRPGGEPRDSRKPRGPHGPDDAPERRDAPPSGT